MILVVATQVLTKRNINGLKAGNRDAVITFTVNNKLQELVNLSFDLNAKITSKARLSSTQQSLLDSLTMIGYNTSVLESLKLNTDTDTAFKKLNTYVSQLVEISMKILSNKNASVNEDIDKLRKLNISDSIYATALNIQKVLENDLQRTLNNNNKTSDSLSEYNRSLAIIAIAAVFIFSAIIINRNLKQIHLISELETATKRAEENAQIKEQFLANMSHEIRTPLNAIKGFSRLMSLTPLNNEQQQYSSIIYDATNNLINIVNDILDISKIEAGKLRIERRDFNIKRVLQAVKQLFINAANEKNIELSYHISDDVPVFINGDPERLSQILINLVGNGIKFTNSGFVKIDLSLVKIKGDDIVLRLEVCDSGIGISKDKIGIIFGRFEQLETGKELVLKGTGLGLSIVKSLTELMEGSVSVSSEVGKGTSFIIVLPFTKVAESSDQSSMNIFSEFRPVSKFEGASVLIVEDNNVNQVLIKYMLLEYDIQAEIVSNGKEAIELLSVRDFDLILLDIQMPVMDGYSCIKEIRQELKKDVPVVAMTAYALPGEKEKCLSSGMNGYLSKPVDSAALDAILSAFLNETGTFKRKACSKDSFEDSYLLQLAGGDEKIAKRIVEEIQNEIPETRRKIEALITSKNFEKLSDVTHHMISTFSPLGDNTDIMNKITEIRKARLEKAEFQKIEKHLIELIVTVDEIEFELRKENNSSGK